MNQHISSFFVSISKFWYLVYNLPVMRDGRSRTRTWKVKNVKKNDKIKDSQFIGNLLALYSIFSQKGKEQSYRDGTPKC